MGNGALWVIGLARRPEHWLVAYPACRDSLAYMLEHPGMGNCAPVARESPHWARFFACIDLRFVRARSAEVCYAQLAIY